MIHQKHMQRALDLAAKGRGSTSPNPMVGAVIVKDGRVIGEGWHRKAGSDHAEIGMIMTEAWGLPETIRLAVAGHHDPDFLPPEPLVQAVHLAEMASNALNLGGRTRNLVGHVSGAALPALGLGWEAMPDLLGEIEARARFMRAITGLGPG